MSKRSKKLKVPENWSFRSKAVAAAFDSHVREQLPWYEIATGAVAHIARCYIPERGVVIDVGASTGNVGRALEKTLTARKASLLAVDSSEEMKAVYSAPGRLVIADIQTFDFVDGCNRPDLIVCFLALMFVPVKTRARLIERMKDSLEPGGAIVIVDKMIPRPGYVGTTNYRLALAAKYEAGASPAEIIAKELSIAGLQRPIDESELAGFAEFFRFGDFAGWVWERSATSI